LYLDHGPWSSYHIFATPDDLPLQGAKNMARLDEKASVAQFNFVMFSCPCDWLILANMFGFVYLLSIATAAAQAVVGSPIRSRTPYTIKETHYVPRKWSQVGRAPEGLTITLNIGLKQSQFDELERHLYEGIY